MTAMAMRSALTDSDRDRDVRRYKDVFGRFCTGVTAVTSVAAGQPVGFACQSFSALSLDPQLAMLSVQRSSTTWPRIREVGRFAVSFLAADHEEVALALARRGGDKFAGLSWSESSAGHPIPDGVLAYVDCRLANELDGGDHLIVVAAVEEMTVVREAEPLLFFRGEFKKVS